MSNSIWKTGDPTYRNDNFDEIIVREYKRWAADGVFYLVDDCTEKPNRWAYLLDIIAQADKAERLQKAVDMAVNALKSAGTHNSINCIARGDDPMKDDVGTTINSALNKIKQLIKD